MLTLAKIDLYAQFKGDMDNLSRAGIDSQKAGITFDEWWQVARLKQALSIIESGLASAAFVAETEQELAAVTADELTREALRRLKE